MRPEFKFARNAVAALMFGSLAFSAQAGHYDDGLMAYAMGQYSEAAAHFTAAAETGDVGAEHMLMKLYAEGLGVQMDGAAAMKWAHKAAEQGLVHAQLNLGDLYANANDAANAAGWYQKAADQGHHIATFRLAELYETGKGVAKNAGEAFRLYQYAASEFDVHAQSGDAMSQNTLGTLFETGKGVKQNYVAAVNWFQKAAVQGDAQGQYNLGRMYAYGRGVDKSVAEAGYWLNMAASQGLGAAVSLLAELRLDATTVAMR